MMARFSSPHTKKFNHRLFRKLAARHLNILVLTLSLSLAFAGECLAVNLLTNPGFEAGTATNGNNWVASNNGALQGWATNGSTNVMQVDGSGSLTFSPWPEFDASTPHSGPQRYVDFGGTTVLSQTFMPQCTALYSFGAQFNQWNNSSVQGQIDIYQGNSLTTPLVAQSNLVSFGVSANGSTGPWTTSSASVVLTAGQTYLFNVKMSADYAVVDEAFVEQVGTCNDIPPETIPGDHYQCYKLYPVTVKPFEPTVIDQFGKAVEPLIEAVQICNPATKIMDGKEFSTENPKRHYVCYSVKQTEPFSKRELETNNQFGPLNLVAFERSVFCVPSSKIDLTAIRGKMKFAPELNVPPKP